MERNKAFWDAPVDLDESVSGPRASTPILPDTTTLEDGEPPLEFSMGDDTVEHL